MQLTRYEFLVIIACTSGGMGCMCTLAGETGETEMSGGLNTDLSRTIGLSKNDVSLSDFEALTTNRKYNKGTLVFSTVKGAHDPVYVLKCAQNHRLANFSKVTETQMLDVINSFRNAVAKELDTILDKVRGANPNGFNEAAMKEKVDELKQSFDNLILSRNCTSGNDHSPVYKPLKREEIAVFIAQVKAITEEMTPEKLQHRTTEQLLDVAARVHYEKMTSTNGNTMQSVEIQGNGHLDATIQDFASLTTKRNLNKGILRFDLPQDLSKGKIVLECIQKATVFNRMSNVEAQMVRNSFENAVHKELDTLVAEAHRLRLRVDVAEKKVEQLKEKFSQMISLYDVNAPEHCKPLERKEIGKIVEMVLKLTRKAPIDEVLAMSVNEIRMPDEVAVRFRRAADDAPVVKNEFYNYTTDQEVHIHGDDPSDASLENFSWLTTNRVHNKGTLVFSHGLGGLVLKCAQHHDTGILNIGSVSEDEAREVCDAFKNAVGKALREMLMVKWEAETGAKPDERTIQRKIETLQGFFDRMITVDDERASNGWKPLERTKIGEIVEILHAIRDKMSFDQVMGTQGDMFIDAAKALMLENPMPVVEADEAADGLDDLEDENLAALEEEVAPEEGNSVVPDEEIAPSAAPKTYMFTPAECSERGLRILEGLDPLELMDNEKDYLQGCLTVDKDGFAKFLNGEVVSENLSDAAKDGMIKSALQKYVDAFRQLVRNGHNVSNTNYTHDDIKALVKANLRVNRVWTQDPREKTDFMLSVLNGLSLTENGVSHLRSRFAEQTNSKTGVRENCIVADERMMNPKTGKVFQKKQTIPFVKTENGVLSFEQTILRAYRLCHAPGTPRNVKEFARMIGLRPAGTELLDDGANKVFKARHLGVKLCNALKNGVVCVLTSGEGNDRRSQAIAGVYHNSSGKTMLQLIDSASGSVTDVSLNDLIGSGKNRIDAFEH